MEEKVAPEVNSRNHVSATAAGACAACAVHLGGLLKRALDIEPLASLAVSGGNSPAAMFDLLAVQDVDWNRVHLFWVDERAVPPGDARSNFGMALAHLIEPAAIPEGNIHRIAGEISPHEAARRYQHDIRAYFRCGLDTLPRFDVIQLGIGDDGHTASLFPGDPLVENRESIAAAVYSQPAAEWRVTLLPGVLLAARDAVVLATGDSKADAIYLAQLGGYNPVLCPAQILTREGRGAAWFVDAAAAAKLQ
jgi:6-phosphogluconolactonase